MTLISSYPQKSVRPRWFTVFMTRSNICANELGGGSNMRYKSNIGSIEHRFYQAEFYLQRSMWQRFYRTEREGSIEEL
jgi:hypothetical protein